jgi:hypothetical protein
MTQDVLIAFFGWMTVLNLGLLALSAFLVVALKGWITPLHARLFGLEEAWTRQVIYAFLGAYKVLIFIFCLIPYVALRLI